MTERKPRSKPRLHPSLWLFGALAAAFLTMSALELRTSAKFGTLVYISRRIETGATVKPETIDSNAAMVDAIVEGNYCRSDLLRAGLVVTLAHLDRQNSFSDYDRWAAAMQSADRFMVHAIGCTPSDGNLWLRLAMIRWAIAEKPTELAFLMTRSAELAPAEEYILMARFVVWNKASKETLDLARTALEKDVRTLITYGKVNEVVRIAGGAGDNLVPLFREALIQVPEDRRSKLRKAGLDQKFS